MKTRNGFVSNSSSSNFIIFTTLPASKLKDILNKGLESISLWSADDPDFLSLKRKGKKKKEEMKSLVRRILRDAADCHRYSIDPHIQSNGYYDKLHAHYCKSRFKLSKKYLDLQAKLLSIEHRRDYSRSLLDDPEYVKADKAIDIEAEKLADKVSCGIEKQFSLIYHHSASDHDGDEENAIRNLWGELIALIKESDPKADFAIVNQH